MEAYAAYAMYIWLQRLATDADDRRRELGTRIAAEQPQWALEALGPVPTDVMGREDWEHRAGWAAAYRELADHTDEADPIGSAPPAGLAEHHTTWRAAYDSLRLPEPSTVEHGLTEGRLRIRARAYEREIEWAPRWVGDELAATHHAADQARINSELAAARARWYVDTAATRDTAERAKAELGSRGIALDDPAELVTADQWLAAHHADQATDELTREIRDETELYDTTHAADQAALDKAAANDQALDTAVPDIREISTRDAYEDADPAQRYRVPTAEESAEMITRAQAALAEIQARHEADEARAAEEARREQLIRWTEDDRAAPQEAARASADDWAREC